MNKRQGAEFRFRPPLLRHGLAASDLRFRRRLHPLFVADNPLGSMPATSDDNACTGDGSADTTVLPEALCAQHTMSPVPRAYLGHQKLVTRSRHQLHVTLHQWDWSAALQPRIPAYRAGQPGAASAFVAVQKFWHEQIELRGTVWRIGSARFLWWTAKVLYGCNKVLRTARDLQARTPYTQPLLTARPYQQGGIYCFATRRCGNAPWGVLHLRGLRLATGLQHGDGPICKSAYWEPCTHHSKSDCHEWWQ